MDSYSRGAQSSLELLRSFFISPGSWPFRLCSAMLDLWAGLYSTLTTGLDVRGPKRTRRWKCAIRGCSLCHSVLSSQMLFGNPFRQPLHFFFSEDIKTNVGPWKIMWSCFSYVTEVQPAGSKHSPVSWPMLCLFACFLLRVIYVEFKETEECPMV